MSNTFKEINKDGWNELISSGVSFANTSLPEYGPFLERNEDDLKLFDNLSGTKVLDIGCADGNSLHYLKEHGTSEIWGIDISEEQIKKAQSNFPNERGHFIVSAMEDLANIPKDYFDYVYSVFSIGYTSDINQTLINIYKYLKNGGHFIMSWTHPMFYRLGMENGKPVIIKSYFDEFEEDVTKGPNKVHLMQRNFMISTIVNRLIENGFTLEKMYEEKTILDDDTINGYKSSFWVKEKAENCPTTLILKCKK